jgi:hypothetical protein
MNIDGLLDLNPERQAMEFCDTGDEQWPGLEVGRSLPVDLSRQRTRAALRRPNPFPFKKNLIILINTTKIQKPSGSADFGSFRSHIRRRI